MKYGIGVALACVLACSACYAADDDILVRRNDGRYERVNPGGAGGYTTRSEGTTYSGVYDRRGDRVGTIKSDAAGTRLYNNKGDRR